jgi:hypothetical protein
MRFSDQRRGVAADYDRLARKVFAGTARVDPFLQDQVASRDPKQPKELIAEQRFLHRLRRFNHNRKVREAPMDYIGD